MDVFADQLRSIRPDITVVNFGCPGESTISFVTGPCPTAGQVALHDEFTGSQLEATEAFLSAHRGQVSPVTLSLGGNDINAFVASCGGDLACIQSGAPAAIAQFASNLSSILTRLRSAAPEAEIIVLGLYNPRVGAFEVSDPLYIALNNAIAQVAVDARVRFADLFPVFNPQGDIAAETESICTLTLICTEGDGHPSDAGYQAMADVIWDVSDYTRLVG